MSQSFTESVETFLKEAHWLTEVNAAQVAALRHAAASLDTAFYASTLSQFRLTLNDLLALRPAEAEDDADEDPDLAQLG